MQVRHHLHRCITLLSIPLFCFAPLLLAEDWPQFRGPRRDGTWNEAGLLKKLPADGLKFSWRTPVGRGWSSPIVASGRVFVTDVQMLRPNVKERVLCFDEVTGNRVWYYDYEVAYPDWAYIQEHGGGPSSTPVFDERRIYALGPNGHLHCLDARTGELEWRRKLNKEYRINEMSCRPSPLIEGNLLIVVTGALPSASVLALDKRTGETVWSALDDGISNSSPIVVDAGGTRQLIVWSGDAITSLNPANGSIFWREEMKSSNNDAIATPVHSGTHLLVSGLMFELDIEKPFARIQWPGVSPAAKRILSNTSTATIADGYIYSARSGGSFACLEAATGQQRWEVESLTERANGAGVNITTAGANAFLYTDRGDLILARLTPEQYTEISRVHLLDPTSPFAGKKFAWSPPSYANGHIFVRNDEALICASLEE